MTYAAQEAAVATGQPMFLYLFNDGITETRLTSEPEDVTHDGDVYTAAPVAHSEVEQTGSLEKSMLDIEFPLTYAFAAGYLAFQSRSTSVTVWRRHRTDTEVSIVWKGRIVGAKAIEGRRIKISVESVFTSLRRHGCRARYMRHCRHALYSNACGVSKAAFGVAASISAMDGPLVLTVTEAASAAEKYYRGGIVEWQGLMGFVRRHNTSTLTLMIEIAGLEAAFDADGAQDVILYPGCNLTIETCRDKFDNLLNFGGFHKMTTQNPFSISLV
jgi:uncharacterized phage protein (TIGR02218 family)